MGTLIPHLRDYEEMLLNKFSTKIKKRTTPIIAIGGFSGTGKDTVAIFVQLYFEKYHNISLKIIGSGDFVRKIAVESGWEEKNLDEFMKHIQKTQNEDFAKKVDIEIEKHALKTALLEGGIFIGRMAPYAIGTHGITIWLEVAARVIANRISHDINRSEYGMNEEELIQRITSRDRTDGERLEQIYGISFRDKKKFDLVLRNEGFTLDELKEITTEFLNTKSTQTHGETQIEP
ncbi:MAG: cytidylate kinase family protein [Candidatus Heimdallarchaeota archaeon]|nr:MAG: cytidylate kinase family protein [Candidatus Heimdallarchaeota archaeon]